MNETYEDPTSSRETYIGGAFTFVQESLKMFSSVMVRRLYQRMEQKKGNADLYRYIGGVAMQRRIWCLWRRENWSAIIGTKFGARDECQGDTYCTCDCERGLLRMRRGRSKSGQEDECRCGGEDILVVGARVVDA